MKKFLIFALLCCGCAGSHHHHKRWDYANVPPIPKTADCGVPVTVDNGQTWLYPCWPQKDVPKCLEGCK